MVNSLTINVPTSAPILLVEEHFNNVVRYLCETLQEETNSQVVTQMNHKQCHNENRLLCDLVVRVKDFDIRTNKDLISLS